MSLTLRRLLNHLPFPHGGRSAIYLRPSWHKPTQFDPWCSQAPFRARFPLRADHFGRSLRRRRLGRTAWRWALFGAGAWVAVESVRAVTLF